MTTKNKTCFIISSIGPDNSDIRKKADEKLKYVFKPVLEKLGYNVIRADEENMPGSISRKIVERVLKSELAIADITDENPNVFYELAIRNSIAKPVIIVKAPMQKPPFDIQDTRCISIDMSIPDIWQSAMPQLEKQIKMASENPEQASISILSDFSKFVKLDAEGVITPQQEMLLQIKDITKTLQTVNKKITTSKNNQYSKYQQESENKISADIRTDKGKYTDLDREIKLYLWNLSMFNDQSDYVYRIEHLNKTVVFTEQMGDSDDNSAYCPISTLNKKYGTYKAMLFVDDNEVTHIYFDYAKK